MIKPYLSIAKYIVKNFPRLIKEVLQGKTVEIIYDEELAKREAEMKNYEDKQLFDMTVREFLKETNIKFNGKTILIDDFGNMWLVEKVAEEEKSYELFIKIMESNKRNHENNNKN